MQLPRVTLTLVVANFLAYGLELAAGGMPACEIYGLVPAHFTPAALFTSLFLHDPGAWTHILGNMAFLALFGALVEDTLGGPLFLVVYLAAGALGGLMHVMVNPGATDPLVGASGAIFGVLAVAGAIRPRLLGFVVAFVGIEVWHAFTGGEAGISFATHLGGFVAGTLIAMTLRVTGNEALEAA